MGSIAAGAGGIGIPVGTPDWGMNAGLAGAGIVGMTLVCIAAPIGAATGVAGTGTCATGTWGEGTAVGVTVVTAATGVGVETTGAGPELTVAGVGVVGAAGDASAAAGVGVVLVTAGAADVAVGVVFGAAVDEGDRAGDWARTSPLLSSSGSFLPFSLGSLSMGMRSFTPHVGQTPFLPARNDLTFNLCPLGQ
jgi:hypothetical protein